VWFVNGLALVIPYAWIPLFVLLLLVTLFRRSLSTLALLPSLVWIALIPNPVSYLALAEACATETRAVRVATANVLMTNKDLDALAEDVLAEAPDIVVFQELRYDLEAMSPALASAYPYRFSSEVPWVTIASRLPLESTHRLTIDGQDRARDPLVATVRVQGQPVTILAAHLTPPRSPAAFEEHRNQYDLMRDEAQRVSGPLLVVGDFNATAVSPVFAAFLRDTGLRIAAEDRTLAPTYYPVWGFGLRIDHVLVRDVDVCAEQVFDLTGSDHRGVAVEVRLEGGLARERRAPRQSDDMRPW
jgi:endonuclease/exonuclease/phosphatase (EEP) superfamily protein YafD